MKISVKFLALLLSTIFILSTIGTGLTLSAFETPSVSVTFDKTWIYVGETYTPTVVKSSEDLTIIWSLKPTTDAGVNLSTNGTIAAISAGKAVIIARCPSANYTQVFTLYIYDSLGIESNLSYYIMNAESHRLMSSASNNPSDYANVITLSHLWEAKSRWKVTEQTDGSFKLYSFSGLHGTLLKSFDTDIEIETDEYGSAEKFRLIRVDQGDKSGLYLIQNGNYYVTQGTDEIQDEVYLTSTPNDFSYWSFMKVEKGYAEFFGFDYEGFNTLEDKSRYHDMAYNYGYGTCGHTNAQADVFVEELCLEDLMMYSGHSETGRLNFINDDGKYGEIAASRSMYAANATFDYPVYFIDDYDYNELSSMRCVMYMSCESGLGSIGYNLVDETYKKVRILYSELKL